MAAPHDILLFAYGTLRQREVQLAAFGRQLEGEPDVLRGFSLEPIRIEDPAVVAISGADCHRIARPADDPDGLIEGVVYRLSPTEIEAADRYESGPFRRIEARLESGREAWLYVLDPAAGPATSP